MAGYIKEILLDMAIGKSDVITVCDLTYSLQRLYDTHVLTASHIRALNAYLSGYTVEELRSTYPNIEALLIQTLASLEEDSKYTDDMFLQMGLRRYPRYQKILPALRQILFNHGRIFQENQPA